MTKEMIISQKQIENRIFTFRNTQVMIDRDLAEMYQVETRILNQAVKRNIERFPEAFRFQLTESEFENWKSQVVMSNKDKMGLRRPPFVFTEQGVAMLSAVLRSETAIKVSIQIMDAFVKMRKAIDSNTTLLQLSHNFNQYKLETDHKFEQVFKALEGPETEQKQGVFFDGQTYDAYHFISQLIKKAKKSIVVIDNYIDDSVITQLTKKKKAVRVYLLTKSISKKLQLDVEKANTQYPGFKAIECKQAHDRFLVLDEKEVYHIGASLKDLGKKWFAFSRLDGHSVTVLQTIKELI